MSARSHPKLVSDPRGVAAPCSVRIMRAYTQDVARHPAPSKADQASRLGELVRTRAALWAELLRVRTDDAIALATALCDTEPARQSLRRCRSERGRANAITDLAAKLAVVPGATDLARELVARLEGAEATQARWLCDAVVRLRSDVVHANLRLVFAVARRFVSMRVHYEDMVADGNMGLFKAVDRFDPEYKVQFSTYAVHWIRHEIGRGIDDRGHTIRVPVCARIARRNIRRCRAKAEARGESVDDDALAAACGIRVDRLRQIDRDTTEPLRLDIGYSVSTSDFDPRDEIADRSESVEAVLMREENMKRLREVLKHVDRRRAYVLRHRFGLDGAPELTLREIGELMGVSRERVRQHEMNALQDLKELLERGGLSPRRTRAARTPFPPG